MRRGFLLCHEAQGTGSESDKFGVDHAEILVSAEFFARDYLSILVVSTNAGHLHLTTLDSQIVTARVLAQVCQLFLFCNSLLRGPLRKIDLQLLILL